MTIFLSARVWLMCLLVVLPAGCGKHVEPGSSNAATSLASADEDALTSDCSERQSRQRTDVPGLFKTGNGLPETPAPARRRRARPNAKLPRLGNLAIHNTPVPNPQSRAKAKRDAAARPGDQSDSALPPAQERPNTGARLERVRWDEVSGKETPSPNEG